MGLWHTVIEIPFDRMNSEDVEKSAACYGQLISDFAKHGYGLYRYRRMVCRSSIGSELENLKL